MRLESALDVGERTRTHDVLLVVEGEILMRVIIEVHSNDELLQQSTRSERDDEVLVGSVQRHIGGCAFESDAIAVGLG